MKTKRCSKCKRELPLSEFSPDKRAKDKLQSQCHGCRAKCRRAHKREIAEYNKKYRQTHKIEIIVRSKRYQQTHKTEIIERNKKRYRTVKRYIYKLFNNIKWRCQDPKCDSYDRYGGRGIEVKCTYEEFFHHITVTLGFDTWDKINGFVIDRTDANGHYEISNLRIITRSQNAMNSCKPRTWCGQPCSSQFKGVSWNKRRKKWWVHITVNRKQYHLGMFTDEIEAALTYDEASLKYHGEFGATNESLGLFD